VLPGTSRDERRVDELAADAGAVQRRGTAVIPVVLPPADIHDLAGWPAIEYTGPDAASQVADRVRFCAAIDLTSLSESRLEALVSDLLQRLGWTITSSTGGADEACDLRITRMASPDVNWPTESLVEVKAYRHGRASVGAIAQLAEQVRYHHGTAGLLVTNGQLTTPARRVATQASESGTQIAIMDGPALQQMLLNHPDIARRHLPSADQGAER
jgi:hypothetical protein